ncbi:RHS repeat-associated core domain-containing protein, partial [Pseudomonas endophytica]
VYTPFGHHANDTLLSVIGFNGKRPEPVTGHYLLGQGYRAYNPLLMRFNSPDSWSPFGEGGINAYAYCDNEPVMRQDSTGHLWQWAKILGRGLGVVNTTERTNRKIAGLYGAVLKEIKKIDPKFTSVIAPANSTTSKTTKSVSGKVGETISKSRSTLDKALKEIKKANKISSKKSTTTPERNFFSLPDSRKSREILNNPILAYSTRNQANLNLGISYIVEKSRRATLEMLRPVERDLGLLINARNIRA